MESRPDEVDRRPSSGDELSDKSDKPAIKSDKDEPSHSDSSHKSSKSGKSLKKASDKEGSSKSSSSSSSSSSSDHSSKSHTSHGSKKSPEPELDLKLSSKDSDDGHDSDTSGDIIPETVDKVESRPDEVDRRPSSGDELSDKSDKPAIKSDKDEPSHSDSSHKSSKSGKSLKKASDKEGSSKSSSSSSSSSSSDHSSKSHTSHGSKKPPELEVDLKLSSKDSDDGHDSDTSGDIIPETVDKVESRPGEVSRIPSSDDESSDKSDKRAIRSDKDERTHSDSSHRSSKSGTWLEKVSGRVGSSKSSSSSSSSRSSYHASKSPTDYGSKKSPEPELDLKLSSKGSDDGHDSDTSEGIIPETFDVVQCFPGAENERFERAEDIIFESTDDVNVEVIEEHNVLFSEFSSVLDPVDNGPYNRNIQVSDSGKSSPDVGSGSLLDKVQFSNLIDLLNQELRPRSREVKDLSCDLSDGSIITTLIDLHIPEFEVVASEYPDDIKINGCIKACEQHLGLDCFTLNPNDIISCDPNIHIVPFLSQFVDKSFLEVVVPVSKPEILLLFHCPEGSEKSSPISSISFDDLGVDFERVPEDEREPLLIALLNKELKPKDCMIHNLDTDFSNGDVLATLIDLHIPEFKDIAMQYPDDVKIEGCLKACDKYLGITSMDLTPADVVNSSADGPMIPFLIQFVNITFTEVIVLVSKPDIVLLFYPLDESEATEVLPSYAEPVAFKLGRDRSSSGSSISVDELHVDFDRVPDEERASLLIALLNKELKPKNCQIANLDSDLSNGDIIATLIDLHIPEFKSVALEYPEDVKIKGSLKACDKYLGISSMDLAPIDIINCSPEIPMVPFLVQFVNVAFTEVVIPISKPDIVLLFSGVADTETETTEDVPITVDKLQFKSYLDSGVCSSPKEHGDDDASSSSSKSSEVNLKLTSVEVEMDDSSEVSTEIVPVMVEEVQSRPDYRDRTSSGSSLNSDELQIDFDRVPEEESAPLLITLLNKQLNPKNCQIANLDSDLSNGDIIATLIDLHIPEFKSIALDYPNDIKIKGSLKACDEYLGISSMDLTPIDILSCDPERPIVPFLVQFIEVKFIEVTVPVSRPDILLLFSPAPEETTSSSSESDKESKSDSKEGFFASFMKRFSPKKEEPSRDLKCEPIDYDVDLGNTINLDVIRILDPEEEYIIQFIPLIERDDFDIEGEVMDPSKVDMDHFPSTSKSSVESPVLWLVILLISPSISLFRFSHFFTPLSCFVTP